MEKDFVIPLPNEPYKDDYSQGKSVKAKYIGNRYLLLAVDENTFNVEYVAETSEESIEFNLEQYRDVPRVKHVAIDADKFTWEAAFLTEQYTHDHIPNYVFTHPNLETKYEFIYAKETGVLSQLYLVGTMKYDLEADKIIRPDDRLHAVSKEHFLETVKDHISMVKKALDTDKTMSVDDRQKLADFQKWLEKIPRLYQEIDHWKIPWPADLPDY